MASSSSYSALVDTIEVTSAGVGSGDLSYDDLLAAPWEANWRTEGQAVGSAQYLDSTALNNDHITSGKSWGLLSSNDRNAIEPAGNDSVSFYYNTFPPLLVVLYEMPILGALLRHPGMAGGMNG